MGEGLYNFAELTKDHSSGVGHADTDSVSLFLGLLAEYGLPAIFFYYYILQHHYQNALRLDWWACSVFPIIILIGMQWGVMFHPANAIFILYFMVLIKGRNAFV
jgi:hypothetical protein